MGGAAASVLASRGERQEVHVPVQRLSPEDFDVLSNPGITSVQLMWQTNAPEAQATITRVTMEPGAVSRRHTHPHSEQTWIVEKGAAMLLLADDQAHPIAAGEVIRTPAGETHGVVNTGTDPFVYLSVTTPPQDFTPAYRSRGKASQPAAEGVGGKAT
jgi:quercetin dioxygenase-like cupin family protein